MLLLSLNYGVYIRCASSACLHSSCLITNRHSILAPRHHHQQHYMLVLIMLPAPPLILTLPMPSPANNTTGYAYAYALIYLLCIYPRLYVGVAFYALHVPTHLCIPFLVIISLASCKVFKALSLPLSSCSSPSLAW